MAANQVPNMIQPTYTKIDDPPRVGQNKNLEALSVQELKTICGRNGLSQSGSAADMIRDIKFWLGMEWGGETPTVKVPKLRKPTGPRQIFPSKRPSPEQVLDVLFNETMWDQIVTETNKYRGPRVR